MNIGFFTDVYTPLIDGVVRSIILYRREIEKRGHKVYVFAPTKINSEGGLKFKGKPEDDERTFRFKAVDSVLVPGYPLSIPVSFKATKKIPKLKLDIVHCHTPVTLGMLGDIVALLSNIPKVYTYHTYYPEYAEHYIKLGRFKTREAVRKFDVFYCNRSDKVIVPSPKLEKVLLDLGVKSRISVLPTGIDLGEFAEASGRRFRKEFKINKDKKILLFVGRLGTEKNVGFLVEVMNKLKDIDRKVILLIIGDGKDRENLEKKVKELDLGDRVIFTGFLLRKKTIDAFAASNIFVFASKTDTQGLVLLEAASVGKPIVMVKDPGLGKIVLDGENGFAVSEDVDIFAEKVLKLLSDKSLYDRMSNKSREMAESLSIANQTEKLLSLYTKIVKEHQDTSLRMRFWSNLSKEIRIPEWVKVNKKALLKLVKKGKDLFKI
jgi:glycosyltransferase involved in cell wall biosynthesis